MYREGGYEVRILVKDSEYMSLEGILDLTLTIQTENRSVSAMLWMFIYVEGPFALSGEIGNGL